jgi:NAD(P)-dependent dehydrogenase (short-subunit alcohol dehydrogenase family)
MKLKDRVVIVTGAAQGIGRAYALRLADEGAKVVIADVLDGSGVQREIASKGGDALVIRTDVANEADTVQMAQKTFEYFERIDVLVNNAAIFSTIAIKPFWEITSEEWNKVMQVNAKGSFLCVKAVLPYMEKQGRGKIINVTSGVFFKGLPHFLHYVASKGAVMAMTRSMARELGDANICVNAIAPGYVVTEALKPELAEDPGFIQTVVGGRCFKRHEVPEDLTGTIVFLASNDSDFITGQTIVVDGGAVMH